MTDDAQQPLCRCGHVPARHVRFNGSPRGCMTYDCDCPGYVPLAGDPEEPMKDPATTGESDRAKLHAMELEKDR